MTKRVLLPIVEGHGDEKSIRIVLDRIIYDELNATSVEILKPIRRPKTLLLKSEGIEKAVDLAVRKLRATDSLHRAVLIVIDSDDDCPAELAPSLVARAQQVDSSIDIYCVLPNPEFETWFVGGAEGCSRYLKFDTIPDAPEQLRLAKGWVRKSYVRSYAETLDQPRLSSCFDIVLAQTRCPSFRKLVRDIARFVQ